MRPSEGAGLIWGQVSVDDRIINLTVTKSEPRRVPLTIKAIEILLDIMPENCNRGSRVFLPDKISTTVQRRPNLFFRRAFDLLDDHKIKAIDHIGNLGI
jgi:integrase